MKDEDEEDKRDFLDPAVNPLILVPGKATVHEETEDERAKRTLEEQRLYDEESALTDPEENPFILVDPPKTEDQSGDGLAPFSTSDDLDQTDEEKARAELAEEVERKIVEVFGEVDAALLNKISLTRSGDHFLADGKLISELDERSIGDIDAQLDRKAQG